jgi:Fic family protein
MEPYTPEHLPLKSIDWEMHIPLIGKANAALARYDGILLGIINPQVLLSPLTVQEAVISSRIEGTQASLEDVLQYEAEFEGPYKIGEQKDDRINDIHEIINYRKAMSSAVEKLEKRPVTVNLIRELHQVLLAGVRGRNKDPGELRRIQNYIAPPGTPIERATFIPPSPYQIMDALSNWEIYLHSEEKDPLVQLAIVKAQFELIHPFLDGNGRIGRMLVPLILYNKKLLSSPMFYISAYLERNRDIYYHRLLEISKSGDWNGWISFFLQAMVEQANENSWKAKAIIGLYNEMKQDIPKIVPSKYSIQVIDTMFTSPVFNSRYFAKKSGIPKESTSWILRDLKKSGILEVLREGRGRRPTSFMFPRLIEITEKIGT